MTGTELVRDFVNTQRSARPHRSGSDRPKSSRRGSPPTGSPRRVLRPGDGGSAPCGRATRGAAPDPSLQHRGRVDSGRQFAVLDAAASTGTRRAHFSATRASSSGCRGDGRCARADRDRCARGDGRRLLEPAEGMSRLGLRVGVHRYREEPLAPVVLDGVLRQPREGARLPRAPPALNQLSSRQRVRRRSCR